MDSGVWHVHYCEGCDDTWDCDCEDAPTVAGLLCGTHWDALQADRPERINDPTYGVPADDNTLDAIAYDIKQELSQDAVAYSYDSELRLIR